MRTIVSLGPLLAMWVVIASALAVHAALALPISELEAVVLGYAPPLFALLWIADDAHRRRCTPSFDFPFLMALAFPLSALAYLVWTRGWRGIFLFGLLLALMYVPWAVLAALWTIVSP